MNSAVGLTRAGAILIGMRLIVPVTILRWPLPGAIASAALDASDVILVDVIAKALRTRAEFGPGYVRLDKWLDSYYLAVEAMESRGWPEVLERRIGLALAVHRVAGVAAFEATGDRRLLMAFPNLFENFYWYVLIRRRRAPGHALRGIGEAARALAVLLVPKLAQEWLLHVAGIRPWQLAKAAMGRWQGTNRVRTG